MREYHSISTRQDLDENLLEPHSTQACQYGLWYADASKNGHIIETSREGSATEQGAVDILMQRLQAS